MSLMVKKNETHFLNMIEVLIEKNYDKENIESVNLFEQIEAIMENYIPKLS
jgi:hypothetical protein